LFWDCKGTTKILTCKFFLSFFKKTLKFLFYAMREMGPLRSFSMIFNILVAQVIIFMYFCALFLEKENMVNKH